MKKLIALLLAAMMLLSLCACAPGETETTVNPSNASTGEPSNGSSTEPATDTPSEPTEAPAPTQDVSGLPEEMRPLVSVWEGELDCSAMINSMLGAYGMEEGDAPKTKVVLRMTMTLNADQSATMELDETTLSQDLQAYMAEILDVLVEATYKACEAQGISREQADAAYEPYGGLKAYLESTIDVDAIYSQITDEFAALEPQHWKAEDGVLYICDADEEFSEGDGEAYQLDGDTLVVTIVPQTDDEDVEDIHITFTRKTK